MRKGYWLLSLLVYLSFFSSIGDVKAYESKDYNIAYEENAYYIKVGDTITPTLLNPNGFLAEVKITDDENNTVIYNGETFKAEKPGTYTFVASITKDGSTEYASTIVYVSDNTYENKVSSKDDTDVSNTSTLNKLVGVQNINGNIYYFDENGVMQTGFQNIGGKTHFFSRVNGAMRTGFFAIDGPSYYFDENGVMQTGLHKIGENYYYFDADGKMAVGFRKIDGKTHFFSRVNGVMRTGFFAIDGPSYYFDENGVMQTGLHQIGENHYYFDEDGKMAVGFRQIEGKTHFFSRVNGAMRTGFFAIDGPYYYFKDEEGMQTGLHKIGENYYYFDADGKMAVGFRQIEGKTHFFSRVNGVKRTGIFEIDGYTYYFKDEEGMQTGLHKIGENFYYFDADGKRASGFRKVNGKKYFFSRVDGKKRYSMWIFVDGYSYYLDENGEPITGRKTVDGLEYNFDSEGRMQAGWIVRNGVTYYLDIYGRTLTGWQRIAGEKCYFNELGELIRRNAKFIIDVSSYQGYIDWDRVKAEGMIDGVILRIGYGSYHYDPMLKYNVDALTRLGIPYGAYIFSYASEAADGYEEAMTMLNAIRNNKMNPTLGIYYDLESYSNDGHGFNSDWISKDLYDAIIDTFMYNMRINGYNAYIYANYSHIKKRFSDHAKSYVGWVAQWYYRCYYNGPYHMWQYSGDGGNITIPTLKGTRVVVDGNVRW